jgi:hypothetical protein
MGCHKIVATDKPEIKKLHQYWGDGKPIPWVRIYKLPDYVQFNHRRHVLKEVKCQECHGPVETMTEIKQVYSPPKSLLYRVGEIVDLEPSALQMGWCLKCHKKRKAPTDCFKCHR